MGLRTTTSGLGPALLVAAIVLLPAACILTEQGELVIPADAGAGASSVTVGPMSSVGGGTTGSGTGAGGGPIGCSSPETCPDDAVCAAATCIDSTCGTVNKTAGTACGAGMICDGNGTCIQTTCMNDGDCESCVEGATTQGTCNKASGMCESVTNGDCGLFACADDKACLTECLGAGLSGCIDGYFCRSDQGCSPVRNQGEDCMEGYQCNSAMCADQKCCDMPCAGKCEGCAAAVTGQADGTCSDVLPYEPDLLCPGPVNVGCDEAGDCLLCGESPPPTAAVLDCPIGNPCASCTGGVCLIDCSGASECEDDLIVCPEGYDCEISCPDDKSCKTATIQCPADFSCVAHADDTNHGLQDAIVNCTNGPCEITCGDSDHCSGATLNCGTNQCKLSCDQSNKFPVFGNAVNSCNAVNDNCE